MDWSDEVRALFTSSNPNNGGPDPDNGNGQPSPNPDDGGSSTPVGAIAGGVVGGVAGIALIGAAVWFFLRKRRQSNGPAELDEAAKAENGSPDASKWSPPPVYGGELQSHDPHEARSELADSRSGRNPSAPVSELQG